MEETIRWEQDRDLFLRLIDRATVMKYVPTTVARHNILDFTKTAGTRTTLSELERRIFELTVLNRAIYLARHSTIRAHARRYNEYPPKRVAKSLASKGHYAEAAYYAREVFRTTPTIKLAGYSGWLTLRALS